MPCLLTSLIVVASSVAVIGGNESRHRPDPWITLTTKFALLNDLDVRGRTINVDAIDGRVTLHGKVDSAEEKNRAGELASRIAGVVEVRNLVQVGPDVPHPVVGSPDGQSESRIDGALNGLDAMDHEDVDEPRTEDGRRSCSGRSV